MKVTRQKRHSKVHLFCALSAFHGSTAASSPQIAPHSVSGFSAGASVAVNHLVAFSKTVTGLGIIGGSPYGCNILPDAGYTCSGFQTTDAKHLENKSIPWGNNSAPGQLDGSFLGLCNEYLLNRSSSGVIDNVRNLRNKPVYLLSGTDDVWVYQSVMLAVAQQMANLTVALRTEFTLPAAHSWVVDDQTCSHPGVQEAAGACCGFKNKSTVCPLPPHQVTDSRNTT
jgi:hypothetical protein